MQANVRLRGLSTSILLSHDAQSANAAARALGPAYQNVPVFCYASFLAPDPVTLL